eukprot:5609856-Alexandrium_andersonii.AAC.1
MDGMEASANGVGLLPARRSPHEHDCALAGSLIVDTADLSAAPSGTRRTRPIQQCRVHGEVECVANASCHDLLGLPARLHVH